MQLIEENSNFHLIIFNFSFPGFWVWELNCMLQTCISLTYVHILWNVIVFNAFFSLHRAWVVNGVENNNNIESFIHKFSSHGASPHNSFFFSSSAPTLVVWIWKNKRKKRAQTHDMAFFLLLLWIYEWNEWMRQTTTLGNAPSDTSRSKVVSKWETRNKTGKKQHIFDHLLIDAHAIIASSHTQTTPSIQWWFFFWINLSLLSARCWFHWVDWGVKKSWMKLFLNGFLLKT